jgi:hypothetical protein
MFPVFESRCAYCRKAPAVDKDHVVPQSLMKTHKARLTALRKARLLPLTMKVLRETVPACRACNFHKASRRLVPASRAYRIAAYTEIFPGTPWREWDGDVNSPAYREAFV